ncbi:MAG: hypothetical protein MO852_17205 [Candidatus Devosia euplotis]|nr:hypothetical protein [Candidatus Devosia euplotis]
MFVALHLAHNNLPYYASIATEADIADLVRETTLEALTGVLCGAAIDFWFTPSVSPFCPAINELATELLVTSTGFGGGDVPLLRGNVVVTSHGAGGQITGLTDPQWEYVAAARVPPRDLRALDRRLARAHRERLRRLKTNAAENRSLSMWNR